MPEFGCVQHVGLINGGNLLLALSGCFEGHMRYCRDLVFCIFAQVCCISEPIATSGLVFTKITITYEFPQKQDVDTAINNFPAEWRNVTQMRIYLDRAKIDIETKFLAD